MAQTKKITKKNKTWIPACAGMTVMGMEMTIMGTGITKNLWNKKN